MKDIVIVSACRTAVGAFGGTLRDLNAPLIGSVAMKEAIKRAGIEPGMIDDVRFGCCMEPVDALNASRVAALMAGIPDNVTAVTINRVCTSAMEAIISGMAMIQVGGLPPARSCVCGCHDPCPPLRITPDTSSRRRPCKRRHAFGAFQGKTVHHGTYR